MAPKTGLEDGDAIMRHSLLLKNNQMLDTTEIPEWAREEFEIFHEKVIQEDFPCFFGTIAVRKDELRYGVVSREGLSRLPGMLHEFMQFARARPKVRHAYIAFFEPETEARDFRHYQERFWEIVNYLHEHDPLPWPNHTPRDILSPDWEFCFSGEGIFLFTGFPAYQHRNSRRFGKSMMILFQPKRVFNGIEGATPGGVRAREIIRPKLQKYDGGMEMHPDFNILDERLAFRWKQYCASDDNSPAVGGCPFLAAQRQSSNHVDMLAEPARCGSAGPK